MKFDQRTDYVRDVWFDEAKRVARTSFKKRANRLLAVPKMRRSDTKNAEMTLGCSGRMLKVIIFGIFGLSWRDP